MYGCAYSYLCLVDFLLHLTETVNLSVEVLMWAFFFFPCNPCGKIAKLGQSELMPKDTFFLPACQRVLAGLVPLTAMRYNISAVSLFTETYQVLSC